MGEIFLIIGGVMFLICMAMLFTLFVCSYTLLGVGIWKIIKDGFKYD